MSRVSTYLNFMGDTEEAFLHYASVFGTEITAPIMRMRDMPAGDGMPALPDAEQDLVMHAELPIMDGYILMATDMIASMGHELRVGNNTTIHLEIDSREETDRLYGALSEGGGETSPMQNMPWGSYWGTCLDRFGVRWMFSCPELAG